MQNLNNHLLPPFSDKKPVILVVTRNCQLTVTAMSYSVSIAERLNHRLLVAYINTLPFLSDGGLRNQHFTQAIKDDSLTLKDLSQKKGVTVSVIKETGKIGKTVNRLCRIVRKIEFIIVDTGVKMEEVILHAPVPVFNIGQRNVY